jgi:hypothetical protein
MFDLGLFVNAQYTWRDQVGLTIDEPAQLSAPSVFPAAALQTDANMWEERLDLGPGDPGLFPCICHSNF